MTNNPVADLMAELPEWHRSDNEYSILLYTLKQDGWRKGEPVMVNDLMIRIENAPGSNHDLGPIADKLIARLTAERDHALARAAAAAMEMRERAAVAAERETECCQRCAGAGDIIRALPLDPEAQKALDKMLAKARGDAIREAADAYQNGIGAILALLTDGGQNE